MNQLLKTKIFDFILKKAPAKTPTGTEFGRLLDCKVALFLEKANLVYSIPKTFPRWSWVPRVAWEQSSWGRLVVVAKKEF